MPELRPISQKKFLTNQGENTLWRQQEKKPLNTQTCSLIWQKLRT